jgi:hypothetical protein
VLLGLLVLGIDPFVAFGSYQLPRIVNGAAFSFIDRADIPVFLVSRDFSIYRIIAKLRLLGITGVGSATAHTVAWGYTALLLWLAWRARLGASDRRSQVLVWLALLNLAALRSPLAPSAYVTAPVLWSLALLAADVRGRYWMAIALAVVWMLIMGLPPLPDRVDLVVAMLSQALTMAINVWALLHFGPRTSEKATKAMMPIST